MNKYTYLVALATLLVAACEDSNETEEPKAETVERAAPMTKEERIAMRQKLQGTDKFEAALSQNAESAAGSIVGEVPDDLLDKIYADLEQRSGANRAEFTLMSAETVQWPDGSLGCPEPGMNYTMALVDGYRVVIGHQDKNYDYRASGQGYFKLCLGLTLNPEKNPTM